MASIFSSAFHTVVFLKGHGETSRPHIVNETQRCVVYTLHRSVCACSARLTLYFAPTIQNMIDGTVLYGVVFRSAAYSGASLLVLVSTPGILRGFSDLPLAVAVALTVVSSGEKVKVKRNRRKFSSHDSVRLPCFPLFRGVLS